MPSIPTVEAGVQARESRASKMERWSFTGVFGLAGGLALLLLITPTLIVLITSFTNAYSLKFPPPGYSTRWYEALWNESPEIIAAARFSLEVASIATGIATLLGVSAALVLARRHEPWARFLDSVFMSPLMLPTLALGLALLVLFNLAGMGLSMTSLVIGHMAICTPYILRTTTASLAQLDPALLDSARSLGGRPWFVFRTVTLPFIAPGIAAGAFIAFMASFDNVAISLFLSDARNEVLPIRMWQILEASLDVRAAAVSGVLILVTIILMLILERLTGISQHMR